MTINITRKNQKPCAIYGIDMGGTVIRQRAKERLALREAVGMLHDMQQRGKNAGERHTITVVGSVKKTDRQWMPVAVIEGVL